MAQMRFINLSNNNIGSAGFAALAEALGEGAPLASLERLNMSGCRASGDMSGVVALKEWCLASGVDLMLEMRQLAFDD